MNRRLTVAGLLAALVLVSAPEAQEPTALSLTCKGPFPKGRFFSLQLAGESRMPNGTVLMVSLARHFEYWEINKLKTRVADAGGFNARIENGRFSRAAEVPSPGVYTVKVDLLDDNQNEAVGKLTKNIQPKKWSQTFHAYGDDSLGQLQAKLGVLEELAGEALAILKEFQEGTVKEDAWKTLEKELEPRIKKLRTKAEVHDLRIPFPAALQEVHSTIEVVHQNLRYIVFKDGKFAGAKDYHAGDNQVKTHAGDPYAHENFQRYIQQAPAIAGREICLWILNDVRRAQSLRPEAAELVKALSKKAGVAEFAERLAAVTPDQVEALEKDVRAAKLEGAPEKK